MWRGQTNHIPVFINDSGEKMKLPGRWLTLPDERLAKQFGSMISRRQPVTGSLGTALLKSTVCRCGRDIVPRRRDQTGYIGPRGRYFRAPGRQNQAMARPFGAVTSPRPRARRRNRWYASAGCRRSIPRRRYREPNDETTSVLMPEDIRFTGGDGDVVPAKAGSAGIERELWGEKASSENDRRQ